MDYNDLNQATAEDILIGDEVQTKESQSSDSNVDKSQEESEQSEENVEDSQQAEDKQKGETAESEANTSESEETGENKEESQEGDEAEGETEQKSEDESQKTEDEKPDPDEFLKEISDGKIEGTAGLTNLLEENERLKGELEKPREPEFASDRAKQAYEYLQKHSGEFEELTREAHRVLSIEPEGMSDRELQFEAFTLQRKDLTRADAQKVFDYKFEKLFGELEDDPDNIILNDEMKVASIEARAKINEAQETLQSELSPKEAEETNTDDSGAEATNEVTPEQIEEVQKAVEGSLNGYEKLQVNLGKEGKEVVNVALDKGQIEALNDAMTNPATLLDSAIAQFGNPQGEFDYSGYRDFMTKFIHHDRIVQESFNQGINAGKKMALDGAKNLETKKPAEQQTKKEESTFFDAFAAAVSGQQ